MVQKFWHKATDEGHYVSDDGVWSAQLRHAGRYDGIPMTRHYAVRHVGSDAIQFTATTLVAAASSAGLRMR